MKSNGWTLKRCARVAALISIPVLLLLAFAAGASGQQPTPAAPTAQATSVAATEGATAAATPAGGTTTAAATPAGTATPDLSITTVVHIDVDPGPFKNGTEFAARVMVDNVEHLAGFQFTISYDPKRLQPVKPGGAGQTPGSTPAFNVSGNLVKAENVGAIFGSSPRSDVVTCPPVTDQNSTVTALCVTRTPPVCLGGPVGASGSGLLGTVFFKSKGGGQTTLALTTSQLILDDYQDCTVEVQGTAGALPNDCLPVRADPDESAAQVGCEPDGTSGRVVAVTGPVAGNSWVQLQDLGWASSQFLQATGQGATIPNRQLNANVQLTGGGSSSNTLLYVIVAVVVAVVLVGGGAGGYLWYRSRRPGASP